MEEKKVLERLQRQCAKAEYCSFDVRRKALKALEGDAEAAGRVVEALIKDRFIDDSRYAGAFARDKASFSGWGPAKISFALRSKGIPREVIGEALSGIDKEKSSSKLEKIIADKYKTLKEDPAVKLKLLRFGLSRGFSYEDVAAAVETVLSGKD